VKKTKEERSKRELYHQAKKTFFEKKSLNFFACIL